MKDVEVPGGRSWAWWRSLEPGGPLDSCIEMSVDAVTYSVYTDDGELWSSERHDQSCTVQLAAEGLQVLSRLTGEAAQRFQPDSVRSRVLGPKPLVAGVRVPSHAVTEVACRRVGDFRADGVIHFGVGYHEAVLYLEVQGADDAERLPAVLQQWARGLDVIHPPRISARGGLRYPLTVPVELATPEGPVYP